MWRVFGFFVLLSLTVGLVSPQGSLASIPIQFYLKDTLKLGAEDQARFSLIISIPLYTAFLFGLMRDRLAALGVRDRQYFFFAAPIVAATYLVMAFWHDTYGELLAGVLVATLVFRTVAPALVALQATVGKRLKVTAWMSGLYLCSGYVLSAFFYELTATIQSSLSKRGIFSLLACATIGLIAIGLLIPREVAQIDEKVVRRSFWHDLAHLFQRREVIVAALMYLTWEFSPSTDTALLNHLTNTVGLSNAQYYDYRIITILSFIPGALLYAALSRRIDPRKLIFTALILGVPQAVPLNFIHSAEAAYAAGIWYGAVGGMASAAVYEMLLRASPAGFEGFAVELGITGAVISGRLGNLWGSSIYQHGGFSLTNWVTTAVYAVIPLLFLLMPRHVLTQDRRRRTSQPVTKPP